MECRVYGGGYNGEVVYIDDRKSFVKLPLKSAVSNLFSADDLIVNLSSLVKFDVVNVSGKFYACLGDIKNYNIQ